MCYSWHNTVAMPSEVIAKITPMEKLLNRFHDMIASISTAVIRGKKGFKLPPTSRPLVNLKGKSFCWSLCHFLSNCPATEHTRWYQKCILIIQNSLYILCNMKYKIQKKRYLEVPFLIKLSGNQTCQLISATVLLGIKLQLQSPILSIFHEAKIV